MDHSDLIYVLYKNCVFEPPSIPCSSHRHQTSSWASENRAPGFKFRQRPTQKQHSKPELAVVNLGGSWSFGAYPLPRPAPAPAPAAAPVSLPMSRAAILLLAVACAALALDPDALSQKYRGWTYYPDWVIPPSCMNPAHCANTTPGAPGGTVDVFQVWQTPDAPGVYRGVYLQFDGVGYETYMATSSALAGPYNLSNPTLLANNPGVIFSPRAGRPPVDYPKPPPGSFDFAGQTFIGPILENYTVGATATLARSSSGKFWYAYGAYPETGYETGAGADGFASSGDGVHWVRETPYATIDTVAAHGAAAWERQSVYAPFIIPINGSLVDFYNAAADGGRECSGQAYLAGGIDALPGYDFVNNKSLWVRDTGNPTLPNDRNASYQASDPKVFWDAEQNAFILIYFCNGAYAEPPFAGGANICVAFSEDARSWEKASTPIYAHGGHPKGYDAEHAHKAWLTADPDTGVLYLFYTGVYGGGRGILLLTSKPIA